MLYLYTGSTGDGKTLNALHDVIQAQKQQEKDTGEKPTVFYTNFQHFSQSDYKKGNCSKSAIGKAFDPEHPNYDDVSDWVEFELEQLKNIWALYDDNHPILKPESIIVIDECQDIYRTRTRGDVPEYILFFEKHRHTGCDFYAITQATRQVDIAFRELVNEHRDLKRVMGRDAVRIKTLHKTIEDKHKDLFDQIQTSTRKYPKHLYGLYRSTAKVTHKKKLPKKITIGLPLLLLFIGIHECFAFVWASKK